jgi:hypothetical protein
MTDRELLEAAAKAAGQERSAGGDLWSNARGTLWNPLTDDGDALRLAVKLHLHLNLEPYGASARQQGKNWSGCESRLHGGLEAATRRAIVRAAAALPNGGSTR